MTAGCYTLDVYCDDEDCRNKTQFTGRTEAACLRYAKQAGWSIGKPGSLEDGSRKVRCGRHDVV